MKYQVILSMGQKKPVCLRCGFKQEYVMEKVDAKELVCSNCLTDRERREIELELKNNK